jgi:branched-chain amino acid transport system substrate-binding protein
VITYNSRCDSTSITVLQVVRRRRNMGLGNRFVIAALSAATAGVIGTGTVAAKDVLVGFDGDFSGPLGVISQPALAGFRTYIDYVNSNGGIHGSTIKVISTDNRGDVATGAQKFRGLVDDGAIAVFGHTSSVAWVAVAPLAAKEKVTQVSITNVDRFFTPAQPYLFLGYISPADAAGAAVQFARQKLSTLDKKRVAVVNYSTPASEGWKASVLKELQAMGAEVVAQQTIPTGTTEATVQATSIASGNPEVVISHLPDPLTVPVVQALRQRGVSVPVINWVGVSLATFQKLNDTSFYGVVESVPPSVTSNPAIKQMLDRASKFGGTQQITNSFFTAGYVQAMMFEQAMKVCGPECGREGFRAAMEQIKLDTNGLTGPITSSASNHHLMRSAKIIVWKPEQGAIFEVSDWMTPQ